MWTVFWIAAAIGIFWIYSCVHECNELSVAVAFERNRWLAGIGSIALLYCMFDLVEVTMTAAWLAPTAALYKKCTDLDNKFMTDMLDSYNSTELLQQDQEEATECSERMSAMGRIGISILTHGHDQ